MLFYIENKKRYDFLKEPIEEYVLQKYAQKNSIINIDSEITYMTLDLIACPYVSDKLKDEILEKSDVPKACRKKLSAIARLGSLSGQGTISLKS